MPTARSPSLGSFAKGAQWSDGTPLTCEDFAFTADWIIDPENVGIPAGKSGFLTDDGLAHYGETGEVRKKDINLTVDCPSDTDMVWTFKEPYEGYILLLNVPLPKHYVSQFAIADMVTGQAGFTNADLPNIPVSGPFKYESATPGQELRLTRNDLYKDAITNGPAYLDGIIYKWYADPNAMIAAYAGGEPEYDVAKDLNNAHLAAVSGYDAVVAIDSLTYEFLRPSWSPKECSLILQPTRNGDCPMSDPNVRKALALALDRETINERLLGNVASLAYTNVSPQSWFYKAPSATPVQDLDAANAVLEADWPRDQISSGFRFRNLNGLDTYICANDPAASPHTSKDTDTCPESERLPIEIQASTTSGSRRAPTTSQSRQDLLALVSGMLNKAGIQVVISPVAGSDIFGTWNEATEQTPCNLSHANFDLALHAYSVSLDPIANYGVYHSSQFDPQGQNNARVKDKELDKLLTTLKRTVDINDVMALAGQFQDYYLNNVDRGSRLLPQGGLRQEPDPAQLHWQPDDLGADVERAALVLWRLTAASRPESSRARRHGTRALDFVEVSSHAWPASSSGDSSRPYRSCSASPSSCMRSCSLHQAVPPPDSPAIRG